MTIQLHKTFSVFEKTIIGISLAIILLAVIAPLIMAILWSLVSPDVAWSYPSVLPEKLDFGRWIEIWRFTAIKTALLNSYTLAPAVAVLVVLLSLPTAYVLGRFDFKGKSTVQMISLVPLMLPGLAVAVFFTQTLNFVGIRNPFIGIVIGHTLIMLPFGIRLLLSAFHRIPQDQIDAARDLGAGKLKVFTTAYMPIVRPAVFVTFIFIFVKSIEEFNISYVLGSPNFTTVPTILFSYLGYNFVRPNAAVVSLILLVPNLIIMFSIEKALGAQRVVGTGLKG